MRRSGENTRNCGAAPARKTILVAFLALVLFAFARYCVDRVALQKVLSDGAASRAAARLSTDSALPVEPARQASAPRSRAERDAALVAAAERWQATRSDLDAASDVVARGLARWGVARRANDASAPSESDVSAFFYASERQATRDEARASASALESTRRQDADPDLDAALAFLSEFETGDLAESQNDALLWTFDEAGAPDAALGLVSERDFDFDPRAVAAKRLARAAANLFFALTLGALLLAGFGGRAFDAVRIAQLVAALIAGRLRARDVDSPFRVNWTDRLSPSSPRSALFLSERLLI